MDTQTINMTNVILDFVLVAASIWMVYSVRGVGGMVGRTLNLIVIGASAGGHKALKAVLRGLSHDIPAALIIMQHLGGNDAARPIRFKMEDWLCESSFVPTQVIQSGDRLQRGRIYVTPPGQAVFLDGRIAARPSAEGRNGDDD